VPRAFLEYKAKTGVPDSLLTVIDEGIRDGRLKRDVVDEVRSLGGDALAIETANECFAMFVRTAPQTLAGLGSYLRHVHTKFYEIIGGDEPCIPYLEILTRLKHMGFDGVFSSEWTGFNFIDEPVALEQIRAQQAMIRRSGGRSRNAPIPCVRAGRRDRRLTSRRRCRSSRRSPCRRCSLRSGAAARS
jgi:hypothetical protein